jgi:hypothetical protein
MKLNAVAKSGLINGIAIGLALHWLVVALLYETVYGFEWPSIISTPVTILALIVLVVGLLSIGPHAVLQSKRDVEMKGEGFLVGAGAGLVVGLIVYLAVGALAGTLTLGTVPLIVYLAEPERLGGVEPFDVLQPIVSTAIAGTYLVIFGHLLAGALIGGIEGLVFVLARGWRRGQSAGSAEQGEVGMDEQIAAH